MLKIVVFDSGYGGELFADKLEKTLPIVEIIRVIDWRNTDKFLKNAKSARKNAKEALRPYIGRVDLIVFANYFLTATSLKYFTRKYKKQKFLGLKLPQPDTFINHPTAVLATKALTRTISYHNYLHRLKRKVGTLCLDSWLPLIDDGELTNRMIRREFDRFYKEYHYAPKEVVLVCSHFSDIIPNLREVVGRNIKIYDGFRDAITDVCKTLKIRGGTGRKTC